MQHLSSTYDLLTGSALISYRLSLSEHPWSAHHKVFDRVPLAGTGLLAQALAAAQAVPVKEIVAAGFKGEAIREQLAKRRLDAISRVRDEWTFLED